MSKFLDRSTLLFTAAVLLMAKFVVMPIVDWQADQMLALEAKRLQLSKMTNMVDSTLTLAGRRGSLASELSDRARYFFDDNDDLKLTIQAGLEKTFADNKVDLERFSWVLDEAEGGQVRTIRALVGFKGDSDNVIKIWLSLANQTKLATVQEVRQRFVEKRPSLLGTSRGTVVLEFYALDLSADLNEESSSVKFPTLGGSDNNG